MDFGGFMLRMYVNGSFPESRFRETIYDGSIWLNTQLHSAASFCELADAHVVEHLGEDPRSAHRRMAVEEFSAGVSYAYKPHRDLWYGGPSCQINTWMTVYPIDPSQTIMINPGYFDRPVEN